MADAACPRRILVLDNAISNGGDAAILLAMQASFQALFGEQVEIRICFCGATSDPGPFRALYPDLHFVRTLWHTDRDTLAGKPGIWDRLLHRSLSLRFTIQSLLLHYGLPGLFLRAGEAQVLREFQAADLIVVSGGGFLNTAWTPPALRKPRITQYRIALLLRKPLIFYAQSIGPFAPEDPLPRLLRPILRSAALVLCRDALSVRTVRALLNGDEAAVHQTMDEALLLSTRPPERALAPARRRAKRIGICMHQWHWGLKLAAKSDEKQQAFEARIASVCTALLTQGDCELVFLTTHQGLENLHRDDVVSQRIRDRLPRALQPDAHLVEGFVHPCEIAHFFGTCDVVLSSRLHGAVLSLIGGTPAVALAYEPKTWELMQTLELADWTLDMGTGSAPQIHVCIETILNAPVQAQQRQQKALARGRELALRNRELLQAALQRQGAHTLRSDA